MAIRTQQSLSGFIVGDPELTTTSNGDSRFHARIGQEHFQRNEDGSFTQLESTFHDLVQYRKAAERTFERFQKGDNFVAEGYVREYDYDVDGQSRRGEEFVAKKIGHDTARHTYTVNRKTPTVEGSAGHGADAVSASPQAAGTGSADPAPSPHRSNQAKPRRSQLANIGTGSTSSSPTPAASVDVPF
ncbi:single-stranded DNA-binding protein [Lacisediminihabitans profunda]|uniref:Single-stranded DNA-binding protein n=1 Tax=Lacisediminihabitans profunda TaxID=2594790 RepID=A0A5C8UPJ1_9MICO|nr:single-stranded DNA-binding protein [Lacisediminihabitans profunda]